METTGREELGLCGWWGEEGGKEGGVCVCEGGALSVSLETVLRPLHLHRTVHDKLREAGGQEVQTEHHSDKVRH